MLAELELLYRTRLPQFRRVAAAISGDRDAGRDIVQDAFATAIRKRRSYRGQGSLEGWLWAIVVEEAGGRAGAPDGGGARPDEQLVSTNGAVHDAVLELLGRS